MSRTDRDRQSRMAEFREADAAYRETGDKKHATWRHNAMRSRDMRESDYTKAQEMVTGRALDELEKSKKLIARLGASEWKREE